MLTADRAACRAPEADLVGDDFDERDARVGRVALVHAVAEVAEPCCGAVCVSKGGEG